MRFKQRSLQRSIDTLIGYIMFVPANNAAAGIGFNQCPPLSG